MAKLLEEVAEIVNRKPAYGVCSLGSGVASTCKKLGLAILRPNGFEDKYQCHTCAEMSTLLSIGYDQQITLLKAAVKDFIENPWEWLKHLQVLDY
jgi:hypothetical protein